MTRFRPLLSIPKYARGSIGRLSLEKQPAESVTRGEEHQDHQGHDQGHGADHRDDGWTLVVHLVHPAEPRLSASGEPRLSLPSSLPSSSPTRYTEPVTSTAPPRSEAQRRASCSARHGTGSQATSSKPSWRASDCRAAGDSARLLAGAVNHARSHTPNSAASMPAASLSSSTPSTSAVGRSPRTPGSDSTRAITASGLCAPSNTVSGSPSTTCRRPGTAV